MADLQTQMKQAVADAAVEQIKDGMVLGLGSGSTAALMIQGLSLIHISEPTRPY